jgi:hypothetical protein
MASNLFPPKFSVPNEKLLRALLAHRFSGIFDQNASARKVHCDFKNSMMAARASQFSFSSCWLICVLLSVFQLLRNGYSGFVGIDALVA